MGLEGEYDFNLFKHGRTMAFAGTVHYAANGGKENSGTIQTPLYETHTSITGEPLFLTLIIKVVALKLMSKP